MKEPFSVFGPFGQDPVIPLILEAPHASFDVPEGIGAIIPKDRLLSHEGYDIGSREMAHYLHQRLNGWLITSERSRLIINHYRTADHHHTELFDWSPMPHLRTWADRQRHIDTHHKPYADAVEGTINGVIAEYNRLPVVVSVHTYTDFMKTDGWRAPFAVVGDESSVLVKVLKPELEIAFNEATRTGRLNNIEALTKTGEKPDIDNPVALNKPYSLNQVELCEETGRFKENDFRKGVLAPCHAEKAGSPWVLVEVRQDIVKEPAIQEIFLIAMRRTLVHPAVTSDLERREYMAMMPTRASRISGGLRVSAGAGIANSLQ